MASLCRGLCREFSNTVSRRGAISTLQLRTGNIVFCVVAYYKCHVCEEDVEESFVGITSDLTHDAHSVHAMKLAFSQHLKSKGLTFEHSVAFSDGCAAQFKSKLPFYYPMNSKKDLGYTSQRCFFGTRHGKSQCDSLGGLVKTSAFLLVLQGSFEMPVICMTMQKKN